MARASSRPARPRAWLATLAILLIAMAWQGFLLQTHRHAPALPSFTAVQAADASGSEQQGPADHHPSCLTCLALAHAAPAMPSLPVALAAPIPAPLFVTVFAGAPVPLRQKPARPWQSRAPPVLLQV